MTRFRSPRPSSMSRIGPGAISPTMRLSASTTANGLPVSMMRPRHRADLVGVAHRADEGVRGVERLHQAPDRHDLAALHVAGEFGDIVGGGMEDQLLRRADLHQRAVLHDGDAVGEADGFVEIVGDEDDGLLEHTPAGAAARPASRAGSADRCGERLVQEPQLRAHGEASARCRRAAAAHPTARADRRARGLSVPPARYLARPRRGAWTWRRPGSRAGRRHCPAR